MFAGFERFSVEEAAQLIGKLMGKLPVIKRELPSGSASKAPFVVPDLTKLSQCYDLGRFRAFADRLVTTLNSRS